MYLFLRALLPILFLCGPLMAQTNKTGLFERTVLYEGELTFTSDGNSVNVPLLVEEIIIDGGQSIDALEFPFEGLLLIQLRGGELMTHDSEDKTERRVNEYWTVGPGERLGLSTEDDSAILRVYLLEKSYLELIDSKSLKSEYKPYNKNYERLSGDLFSKTVAVIGSADNPIAKIVDLNLGPGNTSEGEGFGGPVFLQVQSSNHTLLINGNRVKRTLGATFTLSEGETLQLDNKDSDTPARLRAVIFMR